MGDLQAKRTEEQKQQHLLRTQRLELEAELAAARRTHEATMGDFRAQHRALVDDWDSYARGIDQLLRRADDEPGCRASEAEETHLSRGRRGTSGCATSSASRSNDCRLPGLSPA